MALATSTSRYTRPGRKPAAPVRKAGTWKMAYADFLTALMAFFLLLWLVSGVSPESRAQIADYFQGAGTAEASTLVDSRAAGGTGAEEVFGLLAANEALQAAGPSVVLARDIRGVRIDLVDSEARPLFALNETGLTGAGTDLLRTVGLALVPLDAPLTLEGHTDAFPSRDPARSNWDISSARANAARRALTATGIAESRIRAVTGLADTLPLDEGQPHLSSNRRISILIHLDG